ncbi:MAG: hypothetical protein II835_17805, partial [Fibrobacter sp.]|nr:hypothetical protein [Fibrobacter sp.]
MNDVLRQEFGHKLSDENVNIIDPFTGTGTFITRLIQSGLIGKKDLERKFKKELKANEIVLLAYYIASVNIENAYHDVMGAEEYTPFDGICLTDSFQLGEKIDQEDCGEDIFPVNGPRARAQKRVPIQVVIGNPPYSVGQKSANDNAQNQKYPDLDSRIDSKYAQESTATNKNSLYDSYIKAFRWATDRLDPKNGGVIGFITNGSWIDGNATDGFRKCLEKEFSKIYVFNLRGNARTQGELRRKERDNVFGQGTRTPVSITILVKQPASKFPEPAEGNTRKAVIKYYDIGDYLSREQKLKIISDTESITHLQMETLQPNEHGDWINQRNESFGKWTPIGDKDNKTNTKTWFLPVYSCGAQINRDCWVYNFSLSYEMNNATKMVERYNDQIEVFKKTGDEESLNHDETYIKWTSSLLPKLKNGIKAVFNKNCCRTALYRPF